MGGSPEWFPLCLLSLFLADILSWLLIGWRRHWSQTLPRPQSGGNRTIANQSQTFRLYGLIWVWMLFVSWYYKISYVIILMLGSASTSYHTVTSKCVSDPVRGQDRLSFVIIYIFMKTPYSFPFECCHSMESSSPYLTRQKAAITTKALADNHSINIP